MENESEIMEVEFIEPEIPEPKAEFKEDPDEAWLDDLLIHITSIEEWKYRKNESKVLIEGPLCKFSSQESYWNKIVFWYPSIFCFPPEEDTEQDMEEPEPPKTTRDAGVQVGMTACR